jgi:hypothetical protein
MSRAGLAKQALLAPIFVVGHEIDLLEGPLIIEPGDEQLQQAPIQIFA